MNGAVNIGIFKHLKLSGKVNDPENQLKIKAFKRTDGYQAWLKKYTGIEGGGKASDRKATSQAAMMGRKMAGVRDDIIAKGKAKAAAKAAAKAEAEAEAEEKEPAAPRRGGGRGPTKADLLAKLAEMEAKLAEAMAASAGGGRRRRNPGFGMTMNPAQKRAAVARIAALRKRIASLEDRVTSGGRALAGSKKRRGKKRKASASVTAASVMKKARGSKKAKAGSKKRRGKKRKLSAEQKAEMLAGRREKAKARGAWLNYPLVPWFGGRGGRRRPAANPYRRNFGGAITGGAMDFIRSDVTIGAISGFAIAGVAHYFLVPKVADALDMIGEKVSMLQPVTNAITTYVPYTSTGFVGGIVAGVVGALAGRRELGISLGSAVFGVGVAIDALSFIQNRAEASAEVPSMGNVAYGRTLRDAYGNVAYGGTVVTDFGGTVVTDFGAASMADAAVCGDDFAAEEGQALLDGPAAMAALAGPLPVASGARSGAYSRFAGRRMARWYWLVKCVGLQRAQQIAALSPEKRVKLLTDLRKQALASLDAALTDQSAAYGSLFESDKQQYGAFVYAGAGY
jgi:hypothetical protein